MDVSSRSENIALKNISSVSWHRPQDLGHRQRITSLIYQMLKQNNVTDPALISMLQSIVQQFELGLYMTAQSLHEYANESTLYNRVSYLVHLFKSK